MKCKRLNEVIELLQPAWQKEPDLNPVSYTHLTLPTNSRV